MELKTYEERRVSSAGYRTSVFEVLLYYYAATICKC